MREAEHEADLEFLKGCNGLFVGQLDDAEMLAFNRLCKAGKAKRDYPHEVNWLMELPKVRLLP